jgi:hypothetical protein
MNLLDMIERIRETPGGILGAPSAKTLNAFLFGFAYARKDEHPEDFHILSDFTQFVHRHFRHFSARGWAKVIEFNTNTETDQMELFWKLWDEYCEKKLARNKPASHAGLGNGEAPRIKGKKKVRLPA